MNYPATLFEENILSNTKELARHMQKRFEQSWKYPDSIYTVKINNKYLKIITRKDDKDQSVIAFIDRNNGDVYKPACWSRPAKHIRGNILRNFGKSSLNECGYQIRYL